MLWFEFVSYCSSAFICRLKLILKQIQDDHQLSFSCLYLQLTNINMIEERNVLLKGFLHGMLDGHLRVYMQALYVLRECYVK